MGIFFHGCAGCWELAGAFAVSGRTPSAAKAVRDAMTARSQLHESIFIPHLLRPSRLFGCARVSISRAGPVALYENLVGYAPHIGLGHCVHLSQLVEELPPVAKARLVLGQLMRQSLVVGEPAQQVCLGARLVTLANSSSVTSSVFSLSSSLWIASLISSGVWPGRDGVEREEPGILSPGESAEALCLRSDLLVAHQAAIEPRRAPVGEDVGDRVIHSVVGIAIVGPMVALEIKGLRLPR